MPSHARATRTIHEFERHAGCAETLEQCKSARTSSATERFVLECIERNCEDDLDDGWDDVGAISEGLSDDYARLVAMHFLFMMPWSDVAAEQEISEWQAKWRAYQALGWLERSKGGSDGSKPDDAR